MFNCLIIQMIFNEGKSIKRQNSDDFAKSDPLLSKYSLNFYKVTLSKFLNFKIIYFFMTFSV